MKKTFTKEYIASNAGYYQDTDKLAALLHSAPDNITIADILQSSIPCGDKAWFIINSYKLTTQQILSFTVGCAELCLPVYETTYPNDNRVRDCIEATKQFIDGKISVDELEEKRDAVDAAYCVVSAAYCVVSAVNAVYYAANAAYWAADAVEATNTTKDTKAACYAAYWTTDAIGDEKMMEYLVKFVNNN